MITFKKTPDKKIVTLVIRFEHKGRAIVIHKPLPEDDPIEVANRLHSVATEIRRFV